MKSKTHPRLLCAAGLISLAITAAATAADRTWGGGNLLYTNTTQTSLNDLELDEGESKFSSSKFVDF
jgi:hypothetical protein